MKKVRLLIYFLLFAMDFCMAQNIGIGTTTPASTLHIKGSANISQLIIDANSAQSNSKPLIRLRTSAGADLLWLHSDHANNIFLGLNTGITNDVSFGAVHNIFIGSNAGSQNTTGNYNTAVGSSGLFANTTGTANVALGAQALYTNSTGSANAAIGHGTLFSNTIGSGNTAMGYTSLYANTTGLKNTAIGQQALYANTTGSYNVAIGEWTLLNNISGFDNTATGSEALRANTTGRYNVANGYSALLSNSNGDGNAAIGFSALLFNTSGNYNVANGFQAMNKNTTGVFNTASGVNSLFSNTTAGYNVANGYASLYSNSSGASNTACGAWALYGANASSFNTALGYNAGKNYNMSWNNTMLGANCDVNQNDLYNCIAIGQAVTNTAINQARIGNSATASIGGYANWTNLSDGRFKKDIKDDVKGLDFIMKLKPVTYHLDVWGLSKTLDEGRGKEIDQYSKQAISEKEKILFSGFVAQDVEKAAQETGYDFSGVDKPKNEKDFYGLRYAEFVVPLVKAVQEQQKIIERQQLLIDQLLKRLETVETKIQK